MNILDIICLVVVFIFLLYGWGLGLIACFVSLAGVIIGSFLGVLLIKAVFLPIVIEVILFFIVLVIISGIGHIIGKFLGKIGKFIPGNRLAGALLGLLIGIYAGGLVIFLLSLFNKKNMEFNELIKTSVLAQHLLGLFKKLIPFVLGV